MSKLILAIDQGTTGTRTYLFDPTGKVVGRDAVLYFSFH